jgi:hypothetical protein
LIAAAQGTLHEDGIEPAAEFPADRLEDAGVLETGIQMQADRCDVSAVSDNGDHLTPGPLFASLEKFTEKAASYAFAGMVRMKVDGVFEGVPVGWTWPIGAGIGVAYDAGVRFCVTFGNQVRQAFAQDGFAATRDFGGVWRGEFKGRGPFEDVVRVDGGN